MSKENIEKLMDAKNVEFRDFGITKVQERTAEDGKEELVIEGLACVYNQETVLYKGKYYELHEIVAPGALDGADMSDVIFNYNHCGRVFARTRNQSLGLSVKTDGLHMVAIMRKNDRGHEELYNDIKERIIDKMSFAFTVKECSYEYIERSDDTDVEIRTITQIDKVYDVSAVDIPAYDATHISARRVFDSARKKHTAERDAKARKILRAKLKIEEALQA